MVEKEAKLASSTPTLPLELPPYAPQLVPLVAPVYAPPAGAEAARSRPTSPTKDAPASPGSAQAPASRFGQLVSTVAQAGAAAAATAAGAAGTGSAANDARPATVRCVDVGAERLWIGGSDGAVRVYETNEAEPAPATPSGGPATPIQRSRSPRTSEPASALELVDQLFVTMNRKAADRVALLPRLNKAAILSEGVLTFHALPNLTPLDVNRFPAIRGIVTFAVDEDDLAGGGNSSTMHMCAIKRRRMHWIRVTNEGVTSIKDLPLPSGALTAVLRRDRICLADAENYSIVDLDAAEGFALLPISQSPHPDPPPVSGSSAGNGAVTPPVPGSVPDPRQRPAIACVAFDEFLIASHTGSTTLGVFVTESGDPCRGTLEWASNLRSLVVDGQYTIALLHNNSIEVHSIHTQEIVQVVMLASPSGPDASLAARSLHRSFMGLQIGAATGAHKVELVDVPLLPPSAATLSSGSPRTPTKRRSRASFSSSSIRSGVSRQTEPGSEKRALTRILVSGRNGVFALSPMTLVVQADALLDKGRDADARTLAENFAKSAGEADDPDAAYDEELSYVYMRLAFRSLPKTTWQDAFELMRKARCDPRLVVRMFPDLRQPFKASVDEISVSRGVRDEVLACRTVDDYILDNLNHNYSPHLKPDVESASTTVGLRASLQAAARDCLLSYLLKWRAARRSGEGEMSLAGDSRKVDIVVDTSLVKLLAEYNRPDDIRVLLGGPHDVVLQEVEQALLDAGMYELLAGIWLEKREDAKVLDLWTRIVDGEYEDPSFQNGVRRIFDLTWKTKNASVTEKAGLWMVNHDVGLALKLFTDPKQTLVFDTRDLFNKLSRVNSDAADRFLESAVIQERDADSSLHVDLVKRYISRLAELLGDAAARAHLREQEDEYGELTASTSAPPSLLGFLVSRYSPDKPHALLDRVRLKALLFLSSSAKYDVEHAKTELEAMETKGLKGLTLMRAVVYGKLHLDRQALSLLLHVAGDVSSADAYCLQAGDPLSDSDISACTAKLGLPGKRRGRQHATTAAKREAEDRRRRELAKMLVEMCVARPPSGSGSDRSPLRDDQVARVVASQAVYLDAVELLGLLPAEFSLQPFAEPLSRLIRRSAHGQQESLILKSLAVGQNLAMQDRAFRAAASVPPTVQRTGDTRPADEAKEEKPVVILERKETRQEGSEKGAAVTSATLSLEDAVELDLR
ncbi:hypothetical protein JCM8202_001808 [Rhodotorula sphaerocarpa]